LKLFGRLRPRSWVERDSNYEGAPSVALTCHADPCAPTEGAMPVFSKAVGATCRMRVKQEASPEQEALMLLKLVVILAGAFALAHQYPDIARSATQAVQLQMSNFFPTPR
jgi:hypothetical protein